MSTRISDYAPGRYFGGSSPPDERFADYSGTGTSETMEGTIVAYARLSSQRGSVRGDKVQPRVLRRMKGFVIDVHGEDTRVGIIEDEAGQPVCYDFPTERLRRSGISVRNQPFQMDEVELQTDDGLIVGYRFQPLAKISDAYIETLNFDDERKRKRDLILKEFSKAKA